MKRYGEMMLKLPEEILEKIVYRSSEMETLEDCIREGVKLALEEVSRREGILRRREGCASVHGHTFVLNGDSGMIETEIGGGAARMKWRGSGDCENCDAHLGVTYKEEA